MVLAHTEFGLRVWSNTSAGTDHGWANVVFATGNPCATASTGTPPVCPSSPTATRSTRRILSVYATAFKSILGLDPKSFPGGRFPVEPAC